MRTLKVLTVEDAYAAVNDPANEETMIELAPGEYNLTPLDSKGNPRPSGRELDFARPLGPPGPEPISRLGWGLYQTVWRDACAG